MPEQPSGHYCQKCGAALMKNEVVYETEWKDIQLEGSKTAVKLVKKYTHTEGKCKP